MNTIFLDFDDVIVTSYYSNREQIKNKIKIVADIAKKYNCNIVIEASAKNGWDL